MDLNALYSWHPGQAVLGTLLAALLVAMEDTVKTAVTHGINVVREIQQLLLRLEIRRRAPATHRRCLTRIVQLREISQLLELKATSDLLYVFERSFDLVHGGSSESFPELFNWWFRILSIIDGALKRVPGDHCEPWSIVETQVNFSTWLYRAEHRQGQRRYRDGFETPRPGLPGPKRERESIR